MLAQACGSKRAHRREPKQEEQILMYNQSLITPVPSSTALVDIQRQATELVNDKRLRDTWDAERRLRACGCPGCAHWYRDTVHFYSALGGEQPERERVRSGGLTWYQITLCVRKPRFSLNDESKQ
jgi:hypothetical protein